MSHDNPLALQHTFADELEGLYVPLEPPGFPEPALVLLNRDLAAELGVDADRLQRDAAGWLSGSTPLPGARPLAQVYAGHQFGSYNPQLGDGRALLLGEVVDPDSNRHDLQLKGSGPTPFSRGGDGRAAIDSALREYILSEAMHSLRVPTTRSLAVVQTGESLERRGGLPGAVLTRVAASHLRVGTLQFFAARGQREKLVRLVNYALARHYPARVGEERPALALLEEVARAQGALVARWMLVGFIHGVMNTDNVALSGQTIDYGPAAFMDAYDPATAFSQVDTMQRYAYGQQPSIGAWNMARMAEALLDLLAEDEARAIEIAHEALERFGESLSETWLAGMAAKLGLPEVTREDAPLFQSLLDAMHEAGADYTSTFRQLATSLRSGQPPANLPAAQGWLGRWRARLGGADLDAVAATMDAANPIYVPRNHLVEAALADANTGELARTRELLAVLARPFDEQKGREAYAEPAPPEFGACYQTHCNT